MRSSIGIEFEKSLEFLKSYSKRYVQIVTIDEWRRFKSESQARQWVYLLRFSDSIYAWGTCSNANDRIRKSSVFDRKLTGKYDRRVDYLMLKLIHGSPSFWAFEAQGATSLERRLKEQFGLLHCYRGLPGLNREEISHGLVEQFKQSAHYKALDHSTKDGFVRYLNEVFFARRRHPENNKRTFYWGDSLEPGFLRIIGLKDLESAIEKTLQVKF